MESRRNIKNPWVLYDREVPQRRSCDKADGVSPAEKLSPEHLQLLRDAFSGLRMGVSSQNKRSARNRGKNEECGINFEQFHELLRSVMGPDIDDMWVDRFFSEVDISCTGQVTWQQVCSYLLLEYRERERTSIPRAALQDPQPQIIRHCSHNKREPTVRTVAVFNPPPLRYIGVSRGGQLTVWSSTLHVIRSLGLAGDPTEEVANSRRFRGWTTDAVGMGNVHMVAVATDCRDLHFVDVSTATVFEDVHLFGFRSVPTALSYWHDVQRPEQPSLLLLGDEKGGVHLMWFLNPSKGLFKKSSEKDKRPHRIFFPDLGEHGNTVSYRHIPDIHQEPINRVMFEPDTRVIMTSSESDTTSVVFISVTLKQEPFIWSLKQGAKCFDYNAALQLLVTGGADRAVRLWSRFVTTHPVAVLLGHHTAVLDVVIYQPVGQIFSYSRDAEIKVWDISSHRCLKTIRLQFPCLQPGQIPDHGRFPFLLLSPPLSEQAHLLVGCKDYLALLHLPERRRGSAGWFTDEGSQSGATISCALYNSTLRQVVTGHADSSLSLWDIETGRRTLQILNAHGEEEVTCMTLDSSHKRLITGSSSGTIKVWSLFSGLNLQKLEPVTNSEVTGVTCLHDNKLLAVGWSQRIVQYDIKAAKDVCVRADMSWKSSGVHKSDILAVCQCSAMGVLATGSHDGEVVIWRVDTQGPVLHLKRATQTGATPPIDGLLFLQHRAANRELRNKSVLVSSQAGYLCFWSITGQKHGYGEFYAPELPGERVLSLSTNQTENTLLVSGDTSGWLQIWDICHFALDIQHKLVRDPPPLLQCWKVQKEMLVSVEVLDVTDRSFVLAASAHGSASLWTKDGDLVGCFGQEVAWNITEPVTYRRRTQKTEGNETSESDDSKVKGHIPDPTNRCQTSQKNFCCQAVASSTGPEIDHEQRQQPLYLYEDVSQTEGASPEKFDCIRHKSHS